MKINPARKIAHDLSTDPRNGVGIRVRPPISSAVIGAIVGLTSLWWVPTWAGGSSPSSSILARAERSSERAASFTMEATLKKAGARIAFHLSVSKDGNSVGFVKEGGQTVDLVKIGSTVYFKATQKFWSKRANTAVGSLFANKWVSGPVASSSLKGLGGYFDLPNFLKHAIGTARTHDLGKAGSARIMGHEVTILRSHGGRGGLTVYVGQTRPYYLYRIEESRGAARGTFTLFDYNKPVNPTAPSGALTLGKLAAGGSNGTTAP